jgi:xanthine dehydrogenase YagS FAD-binding subunit
MIKDMMSSFELHQPARLDEAMSLSKRFGDDAWIMAGGNDSLSWFKDRVKRPGVVIDISGIAELKGIRETADGVEIGALTTLTEIERHPVIKEKFGLLAKAAGRVASPQIRNSGTIGGNLSQDTRCWYYRGGLPCYRAGGNTCYADTPTGMNREHTLFNASRCVAVSPSDTAPALVALDAKFVIRNSGGTRTVDAEEFFIGPSVDITRMTVLEPGDVLTTIRIPNTWANATFYFEKVADREVWDFPLVNVALAMKVENGTVSGARICCGGVEARPRRLKAVEDLIKGEKVGPQTKVRTGTEDPNDMVSAGRAGAEIAEAAGKVAVRGAKPLNYNHFKVPLMQNLVMRAIRDA